MNQRKICISLDCLVSLFRDQVELRESFTAWQGIKNPWEADFESNVPKFCLNLTNYRNYNPDEFRKWPPCLYNLFRTSSKGLKSCDCWRLLQINFKITTREEKITQSLMLQLLLLFWWETIINHEMSLISAHFNSFKLNVHQISFYLENKVLHDQDGPNQWWSAMPSISPNKRIILIRDRFLPRKDKRSHTLKDKPIS